MRCRLLGAARSIVRATALLPRTYRRHEARRIGAVGAWRQARRTAQHAADLLQQIAGDGGHGLQAFRVCHRNGGGLNIGGADEALTLGDLHGMKRHAGNLRNVVGVVGHDEEVLPSFRREAAAGNPRHRGEVVIAEPDPDDVLAGEAHEPGVAIVGARAGLADAIGEVELGTAARSRFHDGVEHAVELFDLLAGKDLLGLGLVAIVGIDLLACQGRDLLDAVGFHALAAGGEDRVAARMLERRHARIAERHGAGLAQMGDADLAHVLEHGLPIDLERQFHGDGIDGFG
ncbi:hypothetical protein A7A08_02157 [Methyloligella halotolerans]|uniref:Uncharacterized protein n=1 Tax=Methyloligella halotolerans TaxID=1177755 RepID=A0A1E2RXJ8_9HYPH|nr:hypothetical protein A7A08_02157 [Methyloligella halotolerans]